MDYRHGISYVLGSDFGCIMTHIRDNEMEGQQNSVSYLKTAQQLLGWTADTYYMGKVCIKFSAF